MKIDQFEMERAQCLFEREVDYNLSESGVTPLKLADLLKGEHAVQEFLASELWYCEADGSEKLRSNIAHFYNNCQPENITITNGSAEAIFAVLWTLLEPEGRLAFMVPNYMQGWGLGRAFAGGVDTFRLHVKQEGGNRRWALDLESLEQAISNETNVIMITNPNNPTGAVLNTSEMEAVIQAAQKVNAWLVVDEVYRGAEAEGDISPTFWSRYEKVVITSGLSKAFALPGLRIGWVVAPEPLIKEVWKRHDYLTLTPTILGDRLAAMAMVPTKREEILARTRSIVTTNLPDVEKWFKQNSDLFSYVPPQAGAILYTDYNKPIKPIDLFNRLRLEKSVLITPAEHFGIEKGFRIGYGYDLDKTINGLERIKQLLQTI